MGHFAGRRRRYDLKRTGERQAVFRRLKGVQISQEGSIKGENVVVRETVYHGFRQRRDLSRPSLARYIPQGSERDRSDYVLKLDCDDRADADGEQEGDRSAQAIPENVAVRRACLIDRDLTEISLTFSSVPIGTSAPTERRGDSR